MGEGRGRTGGGVTLRQSGRGGGGGGGSPAGEFAGMSMRAFTLAEGGFLNAFQERGLFRVSTHRLLPAQPRNVAFVKTEKNMAEEITVLSNFLTLKTVLQFTSHSINTSIKILVVSSFKSL